jgi:peptide deformylase
MSVRQVLRMGHPFLRQVAQPVEDALAAEIQELIVDLRDTMQARNGAGLAAPQIGSHWRVVIYGAGAPNPRYPEAPIIRETVLINPVLKPIGTDTQTGWEGCLSVPGLRGEVSRWLRVEVRAMDQNGQAIQSRLEGFEARVVQHECDHLDGVLFPQRLSSNQQFGYTEELVSSGQIPNSQS